MLSLKRARRLAERAGLLIALPLLILAAVLPACIVHPVGSAEPTLVVRALEAPFAALAPTGVRLEKQAEARRAIAPRPDHRVRFLARPKGWVESGTQPDGLRRIERARPRRNVSTPQEHPTSPDDPVLPRLA